jgi:hypothetical protein
MKLITAEQHAKILFRLQLVASAIGSFVLVTSLIFVMTPLYFQELTQTFI